MTPRETTDEKKKEVKEPRDPAASAGDARPLAEKIGFAQLDLSVEELEERIRPRETNVFDK